MIIKWLEQIVLKLLQLSCSGVLHKLPCAKSFLNIYYSHHILPENNPNMEEL